MDNEVTGLSIAPFPRLTATDGGMAREEVSVAKNYKNRGLWCEKLSEATPNFEGGGPVNEFWGEGDTNGGEPLRGEEEDADICAFDENVGTYDANDCVDDCGDEESVR